MVLGTDLQIWLRYAFDSVRPDEVTSNLGEQNDTIDRSMYLHVLASFASVYSGVRRIACVLF